MSFYEKYSKYKQKYLEMTGGSRYKDMKVSESTKKIKTNINNIYISQVQYKGSCGMTVVSSPNWLDYYIDKRGKNVYGLGTDMLYGSTNAENYAKAVCLVGGSTLGLEGICGVTQALIADKENNPSNTNVPAIGATCLTQNILYSDFTHPDIKLGKFAYENKGKHLMIGKVGAGVNTRVGKLYFESNTQHGTPFYAGQGAYYLEEGNMKCFCIVVLNSLGVVHENGELLHEFKYKDKQITNIKDMSDNWLTNSSTNKLKLKKLGGQSEIEQVKKPTNTTLTIFVTNIKYTEAQMKLLSKELHDVVESMVYPYGTLLDGDIFFLVSSKEIDSAVDYSGNYKTVIQNAIKSVF
jgi:L-aminopeptidase/D-esterase-like protein